MSRRKPLHQLAWLALLVASGTCKKSTPPQATANHGHGDEHGESVVATKGPSDLDRPVEELVALSCEHGQKTFECDKCRYEVGFVRLPGESRRRGARQDGQGRAPEGRHARHAHGRSSLRRTARRRT